MKNTLRRGDRGHEVQFLQQWLVNNGYSVGTAGIDGIFGPDTEAAVRRFQTDAGIAIDGIVGPQTWGVILNTSDQKTPANTPVSTAGSATFNFANLLIFAAVALALWFFWKKILKK